MPNKTEMPGFVIALLKEQIPVAYTYHNYRHTLYVQQKAKELALFEHLDETTTALLDTAALWHDTGYLHTYKGHEEESCSLARQYLKDFGFTAAETGRICEMIMATKIPQRPASLAGQILADADLAYLGTADAKEQALALFKEMQYIHPELTIEDWNKQQVEFIEQHTYFTQHYRLAKEPVKQAYLEALKKGIQN